jgi:hypothetical protein
MPSTDTKPELTAKASMAQPVSQPAVYANGLMSGDEKKGILGLVTACPEIKMGCLKFLILGRLLCLTYYSIGLCTLFLVLKFLLLVTVTS